MGRLLIDMDNTLADWDGCLNKRLLTAGYSFPPPRSWDVASRGYPADVLCCVYAWINAPNWYRSLPPLPGAKEVLEGLEAQGHSVYLCSSPPPFNPWASQEKRAWVREQLGLFWEPRLILTGDKTQVRGDILIDDRPWISGSVSPTWKHILYHQPYNEGLLRPRILSWDLPHVLSVLRTVDSL